VALDSGVAYFPTDIGPTPYVELRYGAVEHVNAPVSSSVFIGVHRRLNLLLPFDNTMMEIPI
jgi:hypothetical protein